MKYSKVDEKVIEKLKQIVGEDNVITDKDALENYSHDETPIYRAMPEAAVKPSSTEEVAQIMKLANEANIPITPRSGGTSLSAGAVPVFGGVVLSLEKMNRIKEIDEKNLMAVVEPGIITEQLGIELAKRGLCFPPDPVSLDSCMIGGNIAECAGGPRAMKYGVTKNYVLGIEAVLPDGQIIKTGGKLLKNVTGYDIVDLIVGSEGTLAIVTEATLKLLPMPKVIVDLLVPFVCVEDAVGFSIEILQSGMMPAAIEFMDGDIYRLVAQFLQKDLPFLEANAHIIVELDGDEKEQLRKNYDRIGDIALKYGALDVFVGESENDKKKIWEPRKNTSEALKTLTMLISREDLVVPKDKVPELIKRLRKSVVKYDANLYTFGHLGDGNIHADISYTKDKDEAKEAERVDEKLINTICQEVYEITLSLGGMITAEHGIGLSKIPYLAMALNKTEIDIMKKIKKIFDPKNILNPGKIFSSL